MSSAAAPRPRSECSPMASPIRSSSPGGAASAAARVCTGHSVAGCVERPASMRRRGRRHRTGSRPGLPGRRPTSRALRVRFERSTWRGDKLAPMQFDLLVVGASFAGIACAREAALAGRRVCVIDRKVQPGARLHTTGLLVREVADIGWLRTMPPDLTRPIPAVCVYAPSLRHVRLEAPGYHFLATDTAGLLRWMVEQAMRVGVVFCWGMALSTLVRDARGWVVNGGFHAGYLVGADGPHSKVARLCGLSSNSQFLAAVELEFAGGKLH